MRSSPSLLPVGTVGRRGVARLRLGVPARLLLLSGTYSCALVDLSRSGARVSLSEPPRLGVEAVLQAAGFEAFGAVVWAANGEAGMHFDQPLGEADLLRMRDFSDAFPERNAQQMRQSVQEWVNGTTRFL